jgi:hypothetical protein
MIARPTTKAVLGEVRVGMEGATYRLLPAPPMSNLAVANALRAP